MISLEYNPHNRFSGIADETKLILALGFAVLILLVDLVSVHLVSVCIFISLALAGGISARYILKFLKMFLPVIAVIFILHLFYHKGQTLFAVWFLTATDTGLHTAILNFLRFINCILLAMCFFSFSSPLNVSTKIATLFGLARGRFAQELALVFFIALRFLPVLARERRTLEYGMRARGIDLSAGFVCRLRGHILMMLPLLSRVIGQTDDVAAALALKGDGTTYFVPDKTVLKAVDVILIVAAICLSAGVIYYA